MHLVNKFRYRVIGMIMSRLSEPVLSNMNRIYQNRKSKFSKNNRLQCSRNSEEVCLWKVTVCGEHRLGTLLDSGSSFPLGYNFIIVPNRGIVMVVHYWEINLFSFSLKLCEIFTITRSTPSATTSGPLSRSTAAPCLNIPDRLGLSRSLGATSNDVMSNLQ